MIVPAMQMAVYRATLESISEKAAEEIQKYMLDHNYDITEEFLDYADAIVSKYGEAAGALSARFYDDVAEYWTEAEARRSMKTIKAAEAAEVPTESEIRKTVYGTLKESAEKIPAALSRLVKRTAEDTTLQNAIRDGAEFAWVPAGDTCAFCIMLASRGWQRASKKALKNGHAEHIHANCDCTYTVRFDGKGGVAGYDPDRYLKMYETADGGTWEQRVNSMRRELYAEDPEKYRAQKRAAYERSKGLKNSQEVDILKAAEKSRKNPGPDETAVISEVISEDAYKEKMSVVGEDEKLTNILVQQARNTLYRRNGTKFEDLIFVDPKTGKYLTQRNMDTESSVLPTERMKQLVLSNPREIIAMHNHPHSNLPSFDDLKAAKQYKYGLILCHNGNIYKYSVTESADINTADRFLNAIQREINAGRQAETEIKMLEQVGVYLEVI